VLARLPFVQCRVLDELRSQRCVNHMNEQYESCISGWFFLFWFYFSLLVVSTQPLAATALALFHALRQSIALTGLLRGRLRHKGDDDIMEHTLVQGCQQVTM